jgi:hypothetical protein
VTFVLAGGLAAGTFDITYAWAFWALKVGVPAQRIFQSVAKGLLGPANCRGGVATATTWSCRFRRREEADRAEHYVSLLASS